MSFYEDIYNDYPLRCAEIWRSTRAVARTEGREVTLMLMAATAGLATPWEHLKIQPGQAKTQANHPAFHNFQPRAYTSCLKIVQKALDAHVATSRLFQATDCSSWYCGKAEEIGLIRDMVESRQPRSLAVTDLKARYVVRLLRNALSHNNLYAFGGKSGSEISQLAFFAELWNQDKQEKVQEGYNVLSVPVSDFEVVMDNWFAMLDEVASKNRAQNRPAGATLKLVISQGLEGDDDRAAA